MVPQANVTSIDPIWTTAIVTRNHAYIVYDTLFGLDADLQPQPQMAAGIPDRAGWAEGDDRPPRRAALP